MRHSNLVECWSICFCAKFLKGIHSLSQDTLVVAVDGDAIYSESCKLDTTTTDGDINSTQMKNVLINW